MRLLGAVLVAMFQLVLALPLLAQVDLEYIIPKANPNTSPADLARGEQLFKGQCAGCHGPKGEGGRGAVLAQPRLTRHDHLSRSVCGVVHAQAEATARLPLRTEWQ